MFLFPWLDWGIDISDFEKIDFLAHEPYLAFLAPWKGAFLGPQVEFRPHSGGVEYSTCLKIFIFWKYNVSAFKWRVEYFYTTLNKKKRLVYEKTPKKPPSVGFWLARLYLKDVLKDVWFWVNVLNYSVYPQNHQNNKKSRFSIFFNTFWMVFRHKPLDLVAVVRYTIWFVVWKCLQDI